MKTNKDYLQGYRFSIIIPCYNCETTIAMCLDSIINQSYQNFEILAVNDMSEDNTGKVLEKYSQKDSRIRIITLKEKGFAGGARNVGMKVARNEIFVFLDADVTIRDGYLEILNDTYKKHPDVAGIAGSVVNPYKSILSDTYLIMSMSGQLPLGNRRCIQTAPTINLSYRRTALKGSFFLERNTASEDVIFTNTLSGRGHKLLFIPELRVVHYHYRMSLKDIVERERFYARGFVMSRRLYHMPNKFLLKYKLLMFLCPRIFLFFKRTVRSAYFFLFLRGLPVILYCELCRAAEIIKADKLFIKNYEQMKMRYKQCSASRLAFTLVGPGKGN